jgi:hypothetical protein
MSINVNGEENSEFILKIENNFTLKQIEYFDSPFIQKDS